MLCSENVELVAFNQQAVRLSCKDSDSVIDFVGLRLFQCVYTETDAHSWLWIDKLVKR